MLSELDLMPRVERGAAWLDRHRPGWEQRINLDTLRLENCALCVLGQEFGSFYAGVTSSYGDGWFVNDESPGRHWAWECGFVLNRDEIDLDHNTAPLGQYESAYEPLRQCWITHIVGRRAVQQLSLQEV
jgi:hypothetical protein